MRSLVAISILMSLPAVAAATTRKVPAGYPTIQAAINASVDGDTVLVAAGTYAEKIDFLGKDITVTSGSGAPVTTIHPPGARWAAVTFKNGARPPRQCCSASRERRHRHGAIRNRSVRRRCIYCLARRR
ncbi:MAG: hypothetical protein U1E76_16735 [Planctomycetota bacterium]